MSFSQDWDDRYRENSHMSVWPWSDVVSLTHRYAKPKASERVLELGPGAGANIPFFQSLSCNYFGVEGSPFIVETLKSRFPSLRENILCGDFTSNLPFPGTFDIVLDRGSITHNTTQDIERCLGLVHEKLKPGGKLVAVTWFSTSSDQFKLGRATDDRYTRFGYTDGPFSGLGTVHFFDEAHIRKLLSRFEIEFLEETVSTRMVPAGEGQVFSTWSLVARKR